MAGDAANIQLYPIYPINQPSIIHLSTLLHTLCCRKIYSNMHMHMLQRFGIGHIQRVAMGKSMGVEHKRKLSSPIGATVLDEPLAGWPPPANGLLMARPGGLLAPGGAWQRRSSSSLPRADTPTCTRKSRAASGAFPCAWRTDGVAATRR